MSPTSCDVNRRLMDGGGAVVLKWMLWTICLIYYCDSPSHELVRMMDRPQKDWIIKDTLFVLQLRIKSGGSRQRAEQVVAGPSQGIPVAAREVDDHHPIVFEL
jgi:hypothetical protein